MIFHYFWFSLALRGRKAFNGVGTLDCVSFLSNEQKTKATWLLVVAFQDESVGCQVPEVVALEGPPVDASEEL